VLLVAPAVGRAQLEDHLKCYKVKDPVKLTGFVDIDSTQFGLEAGCKIKPGKFFCVPVTKTVVAAEDRTTGSPITPLPVAAPPAPGDRMCYKIKCPLNAIASQEITDQFGTRTLTEARPGAGFKPFILCTPAAKGPTAADAFRGFPATGQTTCWNTAGTVISCAGTGHDGDVQGGAPLAYQDNGDGTITDLNTGLMWEKKSNDGSLIHDVDNLYPWSQGFTNIVPALNNKCADDETVDCFAGADATCAALFGAGAKCGFAGYRDWRVPNVKELQSIVDYTNATPSVSPAFNTGCAPGCTVLTCSCTASGFYWSSSTNTGIPGNAWSVFFGGGNVTDQAKSGTFLVRAVRGGS
jgi:hypothetical protein